MFKKDYTKGEKIVSIWLKIVCFTSLRGTIENDFQKNRFNKLLDMLLEECKDVECKDVVETIIEDLYFEVEDYEE